MKPRLRLVALAVLACCLAGCSVYLPPGSKADLDAFAPPSIGDGFATKPTNPFPASIATVRVQAPTYTNLYLEQNGGRYGSGRYSIILTHEVEDASYIERISRLPSVAGVVGLNRMLLAPNLSGDQEIRQAASRLHADLVFLYTFDTAFFDTDAAKPLSVITLGLAPTRKIKAVSTASGLLIDTRSGYIYSAYEATEKADTHATSWGRRDTADEVRRKTEEDAFRKLVDEVEKSWPRVLATKAG